MAKAKLTTRAISATTVTSDNLAKASQLTHNQLDSNFINLRDATFGVVADDSATIQVGMDSNLYIQGGSNVTTSTDSAGVVTITGAGTATSLTTDGLTIEDNDIKGTRSNENIVIDPLGTGTIELNANTNVTGDLTTSGSLITDGLTIEDNNITGTRSNEDIVIAPNGTGGVIANVFEVTNPITSNKYFRLDQYGLQSANGLHTLILSGQEQYADTNNDSNIAQFYFKHIEYHNTNTYHSIKKGGDLVFRGNLSSGATADTGGFYPVIALREYEDSGHIEITPKPGQYVEIDGVNIQDNTISSNASNANLEINANGSGTVNLENLKIGTGGSTVTTILDEDAMGSDSATALATQQSIKSYIDSQSHGGGVGDLSVVGSTISSPSNADLTLLTSGSGDIVLNQITIADNTITTNSSNANLYLDTSGSGDLILGAGDDVSLEATDDVKIKPGDDIHLVTTGSGKDIKFWNINSAKLLFYGNYAATWNIIKAEDGVDQWNETGTNAYPDTGDDLWTVNVNGGDGTSPSSYAQGGTLLFEASADWSGSSRSTSFEIQLCQTGSTSLTTPFKIGATGDVVLTGGLTAGTSIENDAIRITDNTILGLRSNDNITITPAGTGSVAIAKAAITGGTVTGITDLVVADGGTGAGTFTDGGILLGSGTDPITAMAALGDSEMIVGNGSTDPVAESGATLRTSIGVGTGDSPQFTGIELGHASDTTITKASSGDLNIEGNIIYRAGGTDVPVADGGTGASTLTDNSVLTGTGTSAITAEGNLTFSGSELAVTGAITATTNITATGTIGNDAVSITDNVISPSRSNDDLRIVSSGTGLVNIGNSDFSADTESHFNNAYGLSSVKNIGLSFQKLDWGAADGKTYALGYQSSVKTDGVDTTTTNARFRAMVVNSTVDVNGAVITHSSVSRGAHGVNAEAHLLNSSSDDGRLDSATGFIGYCWVEPLVGTFTITNAIGCAASVDANAAGMASDKTLTVTNAFGFYAGGNSIYGGTATKVLTNSYNFYAKRQNSATNEWMFYDSVSAGTNTQSRFGAIQLINQASAPTNLADHSWIYALDDSASSEVYVRDEAGNATKISPHNEKGEWEFYSKNTVTGKTFRVNMERMIKKIEEFTGESFIETI